MPEPVSKSAAVVAATTALVGAGIQDVMGVPVSAILVVVAAFMGAAGILSFLPATPLPRMIGTVFFCAGAAIFGANVAAAQVAWLKDSVPLAALIIAAVLQLVIPWLIENRGELGRRVLALFSRGGGS